MAFTLKVTLSGVMLDVFDTRRHRLVVVVPDGRLNGATPPLAHDDETPAEQHVGYLRFNLRQLDQAIPPHVDPLGREPGYEVLHQFDGERVEFLARTGGALAPFDESQPVTRLGGALQVPDFGVFAERVVPSASIFSATPPAEVLMRTELQGGTVEVSERDVTPWKVPGHLNPPSYQSHEDEFGGEVVWTRAFDADGITIRITSFTDPAKQTTFDLVPLDGPDGPQIHVLIANLCRINPLEWKELGIRVPESKDEDFKWIYRLLEGADPDMTRLLANCELAYPISLARSEQEQGMLVNCTPGQRTWPIPD